MATPPRDELDRTVAREDRDATGCHAPAGTNGNFDTPNDPIPTIRPDDPAATAPRQPDAPTAPAEDTEVHVPGFVITGEIARGGMGAVLAAVEVALDREVAIKVLLPGAAGTARAVRRFREEARITARLQHPGIPPVHQIGALPDGRPFLAMKLIRGRTLAAILTAREERPSSLSAEELDLTALNSPGLLHVFEQICHAVGYAHAQGVIHRDLKPANVMVGSFGEVQVMDWGIARAGARNHEEARNPEPGTRNPEEAQSPEPGTRNPEEARNPEPGTRNEDEPKGNDGSAAGLHSALRAPHSAFEELTVVGQAMGTPQYMPPEQARGEWGQVGTRADVFALGGIFAAILTGRPPYTGGTSYDVLRRAQVGDLGECFARLDASGADPELVALAQWCLAPNPNDRPTNGAEVAQHVAAYRLSMEARVAAAETERTTAETRVEEARRRAAEAARARAAAEERAADAEWYVAEVLARTNESARRRRGVFVAVVFMLVVLSGVWGNYREQKGRAALATVQRAAR